MILPHRTGFPTTDAASTAGRGTLAEWDALLAEARTRVASGESSFDAAVQWLVGELFTRDQDYAAAVAADVATCIGYGMPLDEATEVVAKCWALPAGLVIARRRRVCG